MNLVNECPSISDAWRGGRAETARVLGIGVRTLDRKTKLGKRFGGIDCLLGKRGKIYTGKEIKRFWKAYR